VKSTIIAVVAIAFFVLLIGSSSLLHYSQQKEFIKQEQLHKEELVKQEQLHKEELVKQEQTKQLEIQNNEKTRILQQAKTNPRIAGIIDGTLRFYIEPVPQEAASGVQKAVDNIAEIFETFTLSGANVERVYSLDEDPHIRIHWIKDFGKSTLGHAVFKSYIEIELGDHNCNGDWRPHDATSIKKVLWHEIGHAVGYDHSDDPENIMYKYTSPQFETEQEISWTIPDGWWQAWEICGDGSYYYKFSTSRSTQGFDLYVLPPQSPPETFLGNNNAFSYADCGGKRMQTYADTCIVTLGSFILIYNYENHPIELTGEIRYAGKTHWPKDTTWDLDAYKYDSAYLSKINNLFH